MSQTKVKSGLISDQSITASKLDVTGNGNNGELLASNGDGSFTWTSGIATELYTDNAISNLIDGAPGALDTLNELAAALGDDANFAGTVTTALATKIDGGGTANYLAKWTDGDTIGNSVIYNNGTNVGIGESSPNSTLTVSANAPRVMINTGNAAQSMGVLFGLNQSATAGIFSDATDENLTFRTGGSFLSNERMRINSAGNVGIGTSSPNHLLDLSLNDDTTTTLYPLNIKRNYATSSATNRGIGILFSDFNSQQATITSFRENSTANFKGYLTFSTNNGATGTDIQERMRITSNGNVGIGTSSPNVRTEIAASVYGNPVTSGSVQTNGALRVRGTATNVLDIGQQSASPYGMWMQVGESTNLGANYPLLLNPNGGNVGIGTSSPETGLHLKGTTNTSSCFTIENTSGGFSRKFGFQPVYNDNRLDIWYNSNATPAISIRNGGNVGIGTTNPKSNLHVAKPGNRNGGSLLIGESGSGTGKWSFLAGAHYNQDTGSGNGTGSAGIAIAGSYSFSDQNRVIIGGGPYEINAATEISFYTHTSTLSTLGGTERMRITSGGNVGIGTSSPSAKLNVFGAGDGNDTVMKIQNSSYGSTNTSGENRLEFGWSNHIGAAISANKETVNRTGFKIYVEVGYNVPVEAMRITSFGELHVDGDVIAYSTTVSDERLKDNIVTIDNALDKVCELRGVEYDWNASSRSGQHDMGVIAQEVEKVFPFIVREKEMPLVDGNTYKTVDYEKLVGVLIEAVKELKQEIEILKSK